MNYKELLILVAPETLVLVAGLLVLGVDLGWMRHRAVASRTRVAVALSALGLVASLVWSIRANLPAQANLFDGMLVLDPLTRLGKQVVLILSVFAVLVSAHSQFTRHIGEYFLLLLLATIGMMFLVSSENILVIFIALELLSLSLYIMTAFNKQSIQSAEAALKYFLFGGMSAAFMLFGLSLIYGASGELNLSKIASSLKGASLDPLVVIAMIMVVIGFGFKVAAVPFHLWAPDAYQGAPLPAAAFIASGSKVASFFILAKVLLVGFAGTEGSAVWQHFSKGWMPLIAAVAVASMIWGNLAAIVQKSVRRLLAYSAIAHAGYVLVAVLANNQQGMASLLYYVVTYALTVAGAFAVMLAVDHTVERDRFSSLAGFARREPLLALCMMIFILSLAGIPPLAGFFGKFYVFAAALQSTGTNYGLLWLVIIAIAMSTVSLYYYLAVLKQIYVAPASEAAPLVKSSISLRALVVVLALLVVGLSLMPTLFLSRARPAAAMIGR